MLNPYFDSLTNSGANEDTQVELRIQRAERPQLARKDTLDPRRVLGLTNTLATRLDSVTRPLDPSVITASAARQTAALATLKVVVEDNIATVGADLTDLFEQMEVLESGELVSGTAFQKQFGRSTSPGHSCCLSNRSYNTNAKRYSDSCCPGDI